MYHYFNYNKITIHDLRKEKCDQPVAPTWQTLTLAVA